MSTERIIGIDFGTSTSVMRVKRYRENGQPVDDRLYTAEVKFGNSSLVPTLVRKMQAGEPYYGYDAQKEHKKSTLFDNFKVKLESPDPQEREQARALTEDFFTYLAKQYRDQSTGGFFGEADEDEKTLISYPVKWSEETRSFMLDAAKKAGFKNVEGMDEAQAAITAVMVQSADYLSQRGYLHDGVPANILMADMGAGTTDLVLCRYTPGKSATYEILSVWPKDGGALFGGREVEGMLRDYLRGKLPEEDADMVMKKCKLNMFKSWKEDYVSPALARGEAVTECTDVETITELLEIDMEEYALDRAAFEKMAAQYLKGFPELVNGCLKDAGLSGDEVDLVLLTGGHSQWYFVREQLCGRLNRFGEIGLGRIQTEPGRIIPVPRPQETVALGLVYRFLAVQPDHTSDSDADQMPDQDVKEETGEFEQNLQEDSEDETAPDLSWIQETAEEYPDADEFEWNTVAEDAESVSGYTPDSEFELGNIGQDYYIRKYVGKRQIVSIPPVIRGRKVVSIGDRAFSGKTMFTINRTMKKVIIPDTVRRIENCAFFSALKLVEVVAHQHIEYIGRSAFLGCSRLQTLDFGMGVPAPKVVKFPPNLKEIGGYAFGTSSGIGCLLQEITVSKKTKIHNSINGKTFPPKYCAVFYYED